MSLPHFAAELYQDETYETVIANTDASRRIHYRLRHSVFCVETGFEDPASCPNQQERDEHDRRAVHFLVRNRETQAWVAAARLIIRGSEPLPVEQVCGVDPSRFSHHGPPEAEISRLLILRSHRRFSEIRRRTPQHHNHDGKGDLPASRSNSSLILHRLLLGIFGYAQHEGIRETAFFLTAPLKRVVSRLGIRFIAIGNPCEHRGTRYPHRTFVGQSLHALKGLDAVDAHSQEDDPCRRYSELSLPMGEVHSLPRHGEQRG